MSDREIASLPSDGACLGHLGMEVVDSLFVGQFQSYILLSGYGQWAPSALEIKGD